jgi:hypothetical protein
MSASINDLYQKLLESGFSEEELERQVQSKAQEFGGFMSKQGILFIIAKENGINLQSPDVNEQFYKEFEEEIDYDDFTIDTSEVKESMTNIVLSYWPTQPRLLRSSYGTNTQRRRKTNTFG